MEIIFASNNKHKTGEMEYLLNYYGKEKYKLLSLADIGFNREITEDGNNFFENAQIKAEAAFNHTGKLCLADDSGICVPALGGEPGIYSARYAGTGNDDDNIDKLLDKTKDFTGEERSAKFICVLCCILPDSNYFFTKGESAGDLLRERHGKNGFGYDPVFYYPPLDKSFAELTAEEKNLHSHRAMAVKNLMGLGIL